MFLLVFDDVEAEKDLPSRRDDWHESSEAFRAALSVVNVSCLSTNDSELLCRRNQAGLIDIEDCVARVVPCAHERSMDFNPLGYNGWVTAFHSRTRCCLGGATEEIEESKSIRVRAVPNTIYTFEQLQQRVNEENQAKKEKKRVKKRENGEADAARAQREEAKRAREENATAEKQAKKHRTALLLRLKEARFWQTHCRKCEKVFKGGPGWIECEHCSGFSLCPNCLKGSTLMIDHEQDCKEWTT